MAASPRLSLISPLRVWLVFNALFIALVASSYLTYYRLAAADNQRLVESQERLLTRSRFDALRSGRFREFVEAAGQEFGELYIKVRLAGESFEFGSPPAKGHCSSSAHPMPGLDAAAAARVTICRPFAVSWLPMAGVVLAYLLAAGVALGIVLRLEGRTTRSLVDFLNGSGVRVDARRGLLGVMAELRGVGRKLERARANERRLVDARARAELAEQVAHDIRSPVAALSISAKEMPGLDREDRSVLLAIADRIVGIAGDLLDKNDRPRGLPGAEQETQPPCRLLPLVESVVAEKRVEYASREGVAIACEAAPEAGELRASVPADEFKRVLSNLINNAVEALDGCGAVAVRVSADDGRAQVLVHDDGCGIPADVLDGLGRRGVTRGKPGGRGLGLHHAQTSAEQWGGVLKIRSEAGKGTVVTLDLPQAAEASARPGPHAVLVDDDRLCRVIWTSAARARGIDLRVFKSAEEFLAASDAILPSTPVYLDCQLGRESRGEELARTLHERGFTRLFLATGAPDDVRETPPWIEAVVGKEAPWD